MSDRQHNNNTEFGWLVFGWLVYLFNDKKNSSHYVVKHVGMCTSHMHVLKSFLTI